MNIPVEQFLPSGVGLLGMIVSLTGIWFKFQNRMDNLERVDGDQEKKITDIVKWSHSHEKEAASIREELLKDISKLEGSTLVMGEQFKQIMAGVAEIKERLLSLENKK